MSAEEKQVLALLNAARVVAGLKPLRVHPALQAAAHKHAEDMSRQGYMAHAGKDGSSPFDRMEREGYKGWRGAAENVAAGQRSPAEVMASWTKSPGHHRNMMDGSYREVGIGYARARGDGMPKWCQTFGARFGD